MQSAIATTPEKQHVWHKKQFHYLWDSNKPTNTKSLININYKKQPLKQVYAVQMHYYNRNQLTQAPGSS
jgi:hypothetical protein